jgi:tetraacyldisaccharide 4'-kinase
LPSGNLREMKSGKKRADIIIITKCPSDLSLNEREKIRASLHPNQSQKVYFSFINYNNFYRYIDNKIDTSPALMDLEIDEYSILVLTGIANLQPFVNHLEKYVKDVILCSYMDHHYFIEKDIKEVVNKFNSILNPKKLIFTTEKDLMRLTDLDPQLLSLITPLYYVPITSKFFEEDEQVFNEQILDYVRNSKTNS